MEVHTTFIYVLLMLVLSPFLFHYFRSVKRRRGEMRRKNAIKKYSVVTAKGLIEKIKLAAHSRASQEDKDAAKDHMQNVEELVKRFDLDYLKNLGINEMTLQKHAYMATIDEVKVREILKKIRAGQFSMPTKNTVPEPKEEVPNNVIPLPFKIPPCAVDTAHGREARKAADGIATDHPDQKRIPTEGSPEGMVFDAIVIDKHSDVYAFREKKNDGTVLPESDVIRLRGELVDGEIIMEDPETGVTIMIDLAEMKATEHRVHTADPEDPYTWDDEVDTDGLVEKFFADKIAK